MKKRDVITLAEGLDYLILKKFEFENKTYFLAMGIDEKNIYTEDHFFFTKNSDENGEYIEEIEDKELINKLYIIIAADESLDEFPELADILLKGSN